MPDGKRKGLLVVISSPSGGGKTTVYRAILSRHPDYKYSVSTTTRPPRTNERHGVDYFFLSDEEFDEKIKNGEFVEWAYVHGHRYGTLKKFVEESLASDEVLIFDLDVQGAASMKAAYPDESVLIFLLPPSREELRQRLIRRGTDPIEVIEQRLKNAEQEIKRIPEYDYLVINDDLQQCIDRVDAIITAELCRPFRVLPVPGWGIE
ncbi:guanylate kinase [bacterium]|nr:guanylate kinase [bacterium]